MKKPATETEIRLVLEDGTEVTGLAAMPATEPRAGLVLGHGAGTNLGHPLLAAVAHGAALRSIAVLRFNFPYAEEGRGVPDRKPVLLECTRAAFAWMRALEPLDGLPLVAGGKSMGGRIASMAVAVAGADGIEAAGLVFLGYPLHKVGCSDELRVDHLHRITVPMLFVQGERDKLADLEILQREIAKLSAPCTLHVIPEADHSFDVPKRVGRTRESIYDEVVEAVCAFVDEL